jgi:hypothetical protein
MPWIPNGNEIEGLLTADGKHRYEYFIKHVCASRKVWGLHSDGWATLGQGEKRYFPLWPHEVYAERYRADDWQAYTPKAIDLERFLEMWIPGMKANGVEPAIFPVGAGDSIFVLLEELEANLRRELALAASDLK